MENGGEVKTGDIIIWENKKYKVGPEDKDIKNFYLLNLDGTYAQNLNGSNLMVHKSRLKKMENGGNLAQENNEMLRNQAKEAKHHVEELHNVVTNKTNVEPWVVAKMERATTDLSDVTHYLDGMQKMAFGGMINDLSDSTLERMEGLVPNSTLIEFLNNAIYIINDMEQEGFEKDEIMSFLSYKMVQMQKMEHGGKIEIGSIIYVSKEPYMASLSNLYDKPLKVVDIKSFNFATGPKLYYIVETEDGQEEVSEDFVIEQMEHGGSMYAVGGEILNRNITFEDWKGDKRTGKVISILDNGDYEVATDSGMALVTSDEIIKMKKGGYVPKSKKLTAQQQAKLEKVLHEYKMGELHSGSSTGPIVKSRKQALAIGLAEARSMAKGGGIAKTYEVEYEISGKKHKSTYMLYASDRVEKMLPPAAKIISIKETKKMAQGGNLKPIPSANKGLAKLPKDVRNKMGFMAQGGGLSNTNQKVSNEMLLKSVIDGESKTIEGIKMSKSMAESFLDWLNYSAYGKRNKKLAFHKLLSASFNWGLERYVDKSLKSEYNLLKKEYSKHEQGGSMGWKHKK